MMLNILTLFNWTTWLMITIIIILIFWIFYGGKQEYEFVGVKPLSTKSLFENLNLNYTPSNDIKINTFKKLGNVDNNKFIPMEEKPLSCKGEDLMAEILEKILCSKIKRNVRPNFLRNPETGKNLELDCYNEEYAIAVEYNGIQHYKYPSAFHKTEKEFTDQIYRDRLKKKLCDEAGVYLIPVPYWVDVYGNEEDHINDKSKGKTKIFVSREVRYKRLYDYLYEKIKDYFIQVFPEEYEEDIYDDFIEEEDEDTYNDFEEEDEDIYNEFEEEDEDIYNEFEEEDEDIESEEDEDIESEIFDNNENILYDNPMYKKII
jgi:hypothetical protein